MHDTSHLFAILSELDNDQENYHGFVGKSFGQAWHWFKEQMRANSTPLNCFLTYVSLPWHRIVAGKFKAIPSKAIQHFTDVCTFQICWTLGNILSYLATFRSRFELFTLQYFRSYCLFFCKSFRRSEVMDELRANRYFNNTVIRTFACSGLYPNSWDASSWWIESQKIFIYLFWSLFALNLCSELIVFICNAVWNPFGIQPLNSQYLIEYVHKSFIF